MSKFIITGRYPISGTHKVPGNKNAALPMIAACLLTPEPVTLTNLPQISDVKTMLRLVESLGGKVEEDTKNRSVTITADKIRKSKPDPDLSSKIRTSILFAGPLLSRLGKAVVSTPGGDAIGHRRLDTHFNAFISLGAKITGSRSIRIEAKHLTGTHIILDEASVTATENIIMAAVTAKGTTTIYNAACEPHVMNLCQMLVEMGAIISGHGTNLITIDGVEKLHGAKVRISSDAIEAASFITAALVTGGELTLTNVDTDDFNIIQPAFARFGAHWHADKEKSTIHVPARQRLKLAYDFGDAIPRISDGPWPMLPSDIVSILIILATQSRGTCLFFEKMFESRLFFVDHLVGMGAKIIQCDPHRAVITGRTRLQGTVVTSPDIRAGMALIIAALCANGTSTILNAESIDRGYECIEKTLTSLGANIKRIN